MKWLGCEVEYIASGAEVTTEWSCPAAPSLCLHDVHEDIVS